MRNIFLAFAVGLALIYISLSPAAIAGMGYTGEEMRAGNQLLIRIAKLNGQIDIPRNGILPIILDLPFLAIGALFKDQNNGQDLVLSIQPCILTALLVTLVLIWSCRLTNRLAFSFGIACMTAFCTMLWPYAYIGLETKQSLFLLLAAFLAIESRKPESWLSVMSFSLIAGFAAASKSTGAFLIPAVAYLVWLYVTRMASRVAERRAILVKVFVSVTMPCIIFLVNGYLRSFFWAKYGGTGSFIKVWIVSDFLSPVLNFAAFFGSPNKGLWIFTPLSLMACYAIPRALKTDRRLAVFALLTLAGLSGGFSLLRNWSDETWGPRYLHAAIAPLMLVFAAVYRRPPISVRILAPIAASLGLAAAVFGVSFPYTTLPIAAMRTGQNTLEGYQGNIALNHLRFNARLLSVWIRPAENGVWTSQPQWFFEAPPDAPKPKTLDLHELTIPQPVLVRHWTTPKTGLLAIVWGLYAGSLFTGLGLLVWVGWRARRLDGMLAETTRS